MRRAFAAVLWRLLACVTVALAALTTALATSGCERSVTPPLITVSEVSPHELEVGGRLEIAGTGFPQGRVAHVTFRGTVFRPAERPKRGISIEADGVVAPGSGGRSRVELVLDDSLVEKFCGRGDDADHVTFAGSVDVAFSSNVSDAAPIVGTIAEVTLDVVPSALRAAIDDARSAEGARMLRFVGIANGALSARGLPIDAVTDGSAAARAGVRAGDALIAVDGVRVLHLSDLLPASARSARFTLRRESSIEEDVEVPISGFASGRVAKEFIPAIFIVGLALSILLAFVVPLPKSFAALETRFVTELRRARVSRVVSALFGHGPVLLGSIFVSLFVSAPALGPYVLAPDLDGFVLFVVALATMFTARALARFRGEGVRRGDGNFPLWIAAASTMALSVGGTLVFEGALQLREVVYLQGGAPWQWAATQHPAVGLLALAFVGALVAMIRSDADRPGSRSAEAFERVGLFLACAFAVALFFGGWRVPGIAESRSFVVALLGSLVFVAKTWILVGLVVVRASFAGFRATLARRGVVDVVRKLAPFLVGGWCLVLVSRRLSSTAVLPSVPEGLFGGFVVTLVALLLLRAAVNARSAVLRAEPHASWFL